MTLILASLPPTLSKTHSAWQSCLILEIFPWEFFPFHLSRYEGRRMGWCCEQARFCVWIFIYIFFLCTIFEFSFIHENVMRCVPRIAVLCLALHGGNPLGWNSCQGSGIDWSVRSEHRLLSDQYKQGAHLSPLEYLLCPCLLYRWNVHQFYTVILLVLSHLVVNRWNVKCPPVLHCQCHVYALSGLKGVVYLLWRGEMSKWPPVLHCQCHVICSVMS